MDEFRVPDGMVFTDDLFDITQRISDHICNYAKHINDDDFGKQFITNFYYVLNESIKDPDELSKDDAIDLLCDFSIGFLFTISYFLKCFSSIDYEHYDELVELIKASIENTIQSADRVMPYWED